MAQLNHILGVWDALRSPHVAVEQNRCVLVRNKNASCLKCADACTSECIGVIDGQLQLSTENCIGCGTCATICPTGALQAQGPTDRELFEACTRAMAACEGNVAIACETMLEAAHGQCDPEKAVGVTCLGRVDESLLVLLARAGAQSVALVRGNCEGCRHRPGSATAEAVCETANSLLQTWGRDPIVRTTAKLPAYTKASHNGAYDAGRRALLAEFTHKARTATGSVAQFAISEALGFPEDEAEDPVFSKVGADGVLPQTLPLRRGRLLKALSQLGQPQDDLIGTRLWGHVIVDTDRCKSCQMCATFCPTGALKKTAAADEGALGLDHFPARCVKCRCCEDICPAQAITISEEVFAVDLATNAHEHYALEPRAVNLGPHQMLDSYKGLLNFEYVYER